MAKIILIDDDELLAQMVIEHLGRAGNHALTHFTDGVEGSDNLLSGEYDLAILDWQLPQKSGVEICLTARKKGLILPVLMLTSRGHSDDKVHGLSVGADDYLTKPFDLKELEARVSSLLRRPKKISGNNLTCGDIVMSLGSAVILKAGEQVELAPIECALLEFLMRNQGKLFTSDELLNRVWSSDSEATFPAVTTCINRLRTKLSVEGKESIIKTVHGVGYKLEA